MNPPGQNKNGLGENMRTSRFSRGVVARQETVRDLLMVSSFAFWALLLGFAPVLGIAMLAGQ